MLNEQEEKGAYGPYKQSLRKEIYQAYAKYFIENNLAYPCFATEKELEEMRKNKKRQNKTWVLWCMGKVQKFTNRRSNTKIKAGEPYIIRFKSRGNEEKR